MSSEPTLPKEWLLCCALPRLAEDVPSPGTVRARSRSALFPVSRREGVGTACYDVSVSCERAGDSTERLPDGHPLGLLGEMASARDDGSVG